MNTKKLINKTAIIAGGSKGIGKAIACELAKHGCNICLIARNKETLKNTAQYLEKLTITEKQYIDTITCDTSDFNRLDKAITAFIKKKGVPDFLVNCVGYAYPKYINKYSFKDFKDNMDANYLGQLSPILSLLPYFIKNKKGHIINCSSVAGYLGTMGYTAYTPTKFAIAGLSEALRHELKPFNINISVIYPPDTNTPGFENENKTKPTELKIISKSAGLLSPEKVAQVAIKGILKKKFYIHVGQSALLWRLTRHFPKLMHIILDNELRKAQKKITKRKTKKNRN